ncbi:hypothetical protein Tco_0255093 [Tanacetum coccineum]
MQVQPVCSINPKICIDNVYAAMERDVVIGLSEANCSNSCSRSVFADNGKQANSGYGQTKDNISCHHIIALAEMLTRIHIKFQNGKQANSGYGQTKDNISCHHVIALAEVRVHWNREFEEAVLI